ncbi:OmpP1/FadL family transporter [Microbulbifer halophilus]|uniref:OmpP1/FadL family transporter n=1 Tax=Microbulbifer halophilus TaxID=453963 RepID=A0ABW5EH34_9GAMM|nr:outer membrane protein transport protein [Microbulbifer halophilus]MCW8128597.1 outer membrane protein transport protein [Microbulbifer halophilus]
MHDPSIFRRGATAAALSLAIASPPASAGGIMLWEIGTPTLGTASAGWAAMPENAATAYTNPGGTVWRDTTEIRAAGQLLYGDVEFSDGGQTNISGGDGGNPLEWFPGGGAFAAGRLAENIGWGFAMAGNFGLGLDYNNDWAGRRFVQDVDLLGMSLIPSFSWKINSCLSIGAGLNVMGAYFDFESAPRAGLIENDARLRYKDTDIGYGGNLGIIYRPVPETTFGITYTSEVDLEFKDRLRLRDFGPLFEPLLDRFNDRRAEIDTTVPATVTASLQQKLTPATTLYANIAWQDWSEYAQVAIEIDNPQQTHLRADRGYRDTGHFALGVRHDFSRGMLADWSLSTGVAYDNSMATTATVTADTISDKTFRFGLGAGTEICPGVELDLGYTLAWVGDVDIDQRGRPPFSPRLQGSYKDTALHFFGASVQFEM